MSKSLIFLAPGYEEVEMLTVVDMLRRAGIEINMVSITGTLEVTGSHNITIKADQLFANADFNSTDMLILPGGMPGTNNLLAYKPLTDKLVEFNNSGKAVAAVCAAPSVLGALGILMVKMLPVIQVLKKNLQVPLTRNNQLSVMAMLLQAAAWAHVLTLQVK